MLCALGNECVLLYVHWVLAIQCAFLCVLVSCQDRGITSLIQGQSLKKNTLFLKFETAAESIINLSKSPTMILKRCYVWSCPPGATDLQHVLSKSERRASLLP